MEVLQGWLLVLDAAGSSGEAVGVGVEGLGLEFPPHGPLWVTIWALSLYKSWVSRRRIQELPQFLMPRLRIPRILFPTYSIGQSRYKSSSDSREGHINSNA